MEECDAFLIAGSPVLWLLRHDLLHSCLDRASERRQRAELSGKKKGFRRVSFHTATLYNDRLN
jgi:hypothetical protein